MAEEFKCVHCGKEARNIDNRVIFVRAQVNDKWGTHACCGVCWNERNPNRDACTCDVSKM